MTTISNDTSKPEDPSSFSSLTERRETLISAKQPHKAKDEVILAVKDLSVSFHQDGTEKKVLRGLSFTVHRGKTLALVGESGSGKSTVALSSMRLLPRRVASYPSGSIRFKGQELINSDEKTLRTIRGNGIAMIFQEPMISLNPLHTVERHISESLRLHSDLRGKRARLRIIELLRQVGLDEAEKRLHSYPHHLSGGQRQRVMIASALAHNPDLLIADEPTTALDVIIQAQILTFLKEWQRKKVMAMLLVTHDLNIVRRFADHVCIIKEGQIVEQGDVSQVFRQPRHPYTQNLLAAEMTGEMPPPDPNAPVILQTHGLRVRFPIRRGILRRTVGNIDAVNDIDITLRAGHTLGVAGGSGSGKTTMALALLRLIPSQGRVLYLGRDICLLSPREMRHLRSKLQIVFQDPYGSLSPRLSVAQIVEEGLLVHHRTLSAEDRRTRVLNIMKEVGLNPAEANCYPHEFSGGQRQRIAIARATVLQPDLIVLDEPTSALDMSTQAQMIKTLLHLQRHYGVSYLLISHDLRVLRAMAHEILIIHNGNVVETGPAHSILSTPKTAYAKMLVGATLKFEVGSGEPAK